MLGRAYGFSKVDIGQLTLTQLENYLTQVPYVLEWSDKFGQSPGEDEQEQDELTNVEEMVREALCKTQE